MSTRVPVFGFVLSSLLHFGVFAQFQVFENGTVANSTNVALSTACVNALQSTVQCNSSLVSIAVSDYFYQLDDSDFTSLCSSTCSSSLAKYHNSGVSSCAGQPQPWSGYPATYFGDVYWSSYNLTCLTDSKTGKSCIVLCSPCVLSLYQQLQGTAYSYYDSVMATEWATIQKTCGVSFPTAVPVNPTNVTAIPGYAPNNFTTSNVCYSGNTYTVASGDNCIAISKAKGVSTGALININSLLPDCSNLQAGATLCLPQPCITHTVVTGDTCASITNDSSISFTQFSAWNPSINNYCTNLIAGQSVCIGLPGTPYNGTTIAGATGTQTAVYATATVAAPSNLAFQSTTQCGKYYTVVTGDDCSLIVLNNTITLSLFEAINPSINANCTNLVPGLAYCVSPTADWNTTSTTTTTSGYVSPPDPTPTGTTSYCYVWHVIVANDNCDLLESEYGITFTQLQQWNPNLNSTCGNLILGDAYCVSGDAAISRTSTTSNPMSTTTSTKTTSVSIPGPTQSGITPGCTAYYLTKSGGGDTCASIESQFGITFAQFYAWNPAIGSNCGALWLGEAYCVAGPPVATSTTVTAPAPTQSGITANCNAYTVTPSQGASCAAIESQYGITFAQFYAWNPAIGSGCTNLWAGEAYCVGVSS
ncbi:hypothetical protein DL95DRAFT_347253 [Leptodontidium sp. 2 PMI_412]|nr:hypothetical protein DL95DRAFT_347253 [Leptodontidium sp. 2 PMI_412]